MPAPSLSPHLRPRRPQYGVLSALLCPLAAALLGPASAQQLTEDGRISGAVGAAVNYLADDTGPDHGLAWGFAQASAVSTSWRGFSVEGTALGVTDLWQQSGGDFDKVFRQPVDLRELFVQWRAPSSGCGVTIGRRAFPANPALDGDSQQGAGMTFTFPIGTSLDLTVLNRWIKYSTTNYDAWGITGWRNVNAVHPQAGDAFLAVSASLPLGPVVTISPFLNYQEAVLSVYGATVDLTLPVSALPFATSNSTPFDGSRNRYWKTELILAYYQNHFPLPIAPDYQDVWSGRIHSGIEHEDFTAGLGIFWIGDGLLDTGAGLFANFDPLQEDDLYPFNDQNHAHLFYIDSSAKLGKLTVQTALGIGRNDAISRDSVELDLFFSYPLSKRAVLAGYLVRVDFSGDEPPNYTKIGTSIRYAF